MRYPARPVGRPLLDVLARSLTLAHPALEYATQAPSLRRGPPDLVLKASWVHILLDQTARAAVRGLFRAEHRNLSCNSVIEQMERRRANTRRRFHLAEGRYPPRSRLGGSGRRRPK